MKRLIILLIILTGTVFAFAQNSGAVIRETTGTVELKIGGSTDWVAASPGDRIDRATIISTGFRSTALLAVGSSTIFVRPLTRLSLENLLNQDNTETINLGLRSGRIQVDVKAPAGSRTEFTVQSPMVTASVRGTVFDLDTENIKVFEGAVRFEPAASASGTVVVNAGQSSQMDTIAGQVLNPLVHAETERRLPALAGQNSALSGVGGGAVPERGTVDFSGITIKPKIP